MSAAVFSLSAECAGIHRGALSHDVDPRLRRSDGRNADVLCSHEGVSEGPPTMIFDFTGGASFAPLDASYCVGWTHESVGSPVAVAEEAMVWSLVLFLLKA